MPHYLDPKNDLTFKRVFGEHKHLCMSLLNSLLPLDESQQIVKIEYNSSELIPELPIVRHSIVDVRCTDIRGRQFIVEMQMYWSEAFKSRILFNASKAYVMQLDQSDDFKLLQPVYALGLVNDCFEKSPGMESEYYHHYKIVNIKDTEKQIKGLEFIFIELPKFVPQNRAEKRLHELWLRFLTEINERTKEAPAELLANKDTREAMKYAEVAAYTKEQLEAYDRVRIDILTERSVISLARREGEAIGQEKGWEKGQQEGIKKGIKKGLEEGKKKGLEEGKKEGIKAGMRGVALAGLKKGLSLEDIQELTGLSADEIRALQ